MYSKDLGRDEQSSHTEYALQSFEERIDNAAAFWKESLAALVELASKRDIRLGENDIHGVMESLEDTIDDNVRTAEESLKGNYTTFTVFSRKKRDEMILAAAKATGGQLCTRLLSASDALLQALRPFPTNPATPALAAKLEG